MSTIAYTLEQQMDELAAFMKNCLSLEMRVKNSEIEQTVKNMERFGFAFKNSWSSMELRDHTVIEFWKKELIK
jgi:hypothetical protein